MLDARAGQFRVAGGSRHARCFESRLRAAKRLGGGGALGLHALRLDPHVGRLDVELREHVRDPFARRRCMLERVAERRGRIDIREHFAASGLDIGFESLDLAMRRFVGVRFPGERRRRPVAFNRCCIRRCVARRQRRTRRLTSRVQGATLGQDAGGAHLERLHLLAIERNLLLLTGDGELAGMRHLSRLARARFGFHELDANAAERRFHIGDMRGGERFARARLREPRARRRNRLRQLPVLPREQHFLPSPQLVAQPPVSPRLRRLALQRATLLLHLEHDVVDAEQVLLRRFELELRCTAPRLVLRHAGRFLDELPSIRRPRAQDHPDLSLLDDRVSLCTEPRVHEELVDVAQPADLAVDEILALAGPVQPPRHFDLAGNGLNNFFRGGVEAVAVAMMTVAVAVRLLVGKRRARDALEHPAQTQPHLRSGRRLARVAAAEDHVLHALAAKAFRALLAHHPGDRIGDVALATPVRADNGGHPFVEGELRPVGERFEAVDFEAVKAHRYTCTVLRSRFSVLRSVLGSRVREPRPKNRERRTENVERPSKASRSGWETDRIDRLRSVRHPRRTAAPRPQSGGQCSKAHLLGQDQTVAQLVVFRAAAPLSSSLFCRWPARARSACALR